MSELIREFTMSVDGQGGGGFVARVRAEPDDAGLWHGWLEFLPQDGGPALQTDRETTQAERDDLDYWASGLTSAYLEMALERARPTDSREPAAPPPLPEVRYDAARIREPQADSAVVRIEVETLDPMLPVRVMGTSRLFEGRARRVPGAGILVYDGARADDGKPTRHAILVQYGSENAAAVMANHLWSDLHGAGATLLIEGERVDVDNHEIHERLRALLHAARS